MSREDLENRAIKLSCYLFSRSIPDNLQDKLFEYIRNLSDKYLEYYVEQAQCLYDRKTISRSYRHRISPNAIKLCLKLADTGYFVFPYIEKIATKGFDTRGGTYSFSMPLLVAKNALHNDIVSYGPINKLVTKKAKLDIGQNHFGDLEVDYI